MIHVSERILIEHLLRHRRFDQFDDFGEAIGIGDGHIGEDFAVEFDLGLDQAGDEFAVAQAVHPRGGVDADDPQFAEFAFPVAAVAIGDRRRRGSSVSLAVRSSFRRPPTKPLTFLKRRFLARVRAAPLTVRMIDIPYAWREPGPSRTAGSVRKPVSLGVDKSLVNTRVAASPDQAANLAERMATDIDSRLDTPVITGAKC